VKGNKIGDPRRLESAAEGVFCGGQGEKLRTERYGRKKKVNWIGRGT
jgi:hypothetical protein